MSDFFATPWTICSPPGFSVHGFSRQEYWSGLHFLFQGIFPTQVLNPWFLLSLLHGQADSLPLNYQGSWLNICIYIKYVSVQFSHLVVSNSLWPHGLQHARLPCPSPIHRVYSNSCPLNWWCHPTISSSVVPFSSRLQSFSASGSFRISQFFTTGGQSIWVFTFSISPSNECSGLISFKDGLVESPCSPKGSQESSSTPQFKHQFFTYSYM